MNSYTRYQTPLFPPIYVDLDDVVSETLRAFSDLLKATYGREIAYEEIFSFDLRKSFSLSDEEYLYFMHRAHEPDILVDKIKPITQARETLAAWSKAGANITIVTGRPISTYDSTHSWLINNSIPFHSLQFVRKYAGNELVPTRRKPLTLRSLQKAEFTFCVEDSAKMAKYLVQSVGSPVLLLNKPWNRSALSTALEANNLLHRCQSWDVAHNEGLKLIRLAQGRYRHVS